MEQVQQAQQGVDDGGEELRLVLQMTAIFMSLCAGVGGLWLLLTPLEGGGKGNKNFSSSRWLASAALNPGKRHWEEFSLRYSAVWIACFAAIVAFEVGGHE